MHLRRKYAILSRDDRPGAALRRAARWDTPPAERNWKSEKCLEGQQLAWLAVVLQHEITPWASESCKSRLIDARTSALRAGRLVHINHHSSYQDCVERQTTSIWSDHELCLCTAAVEERWILVMYRGLSSRTRLDSIPRHLVHLTFI